jgi:hypothetical protein
MIDIQWFNNGLDDLKGLEHIAIKSNLVIARVKREKEFSGFWVARDVKGDYLFRDQYRSDVFEWVEDRFGN